MDGAAKATLPIVRAPIRAAISASVTWRLVIGICLGLRVAFRLWTTPRCGSCSPSRPDCLHSAAITGNWMSRKTPKGRPRRPDGARSGAISSISTAIPMWRKRASSSSDICRTRRFRPRTRWVGTSHNTIRRSRCGTSRMATTRFTLELEWRQLAPTIAAPTAARARLRSTAWQVQLRGLTR